MQSGSKTRPIVEVRSFPYQPKRAGLREEIKIDATREKLAKSVLRQVQVAVEKAP